MSTKPVQHAQQSQSSPAQSLPPHSTTLSSQPRNAKWRKFLHMISLSISNFSYIYLTFINLNRIRDEPFYRYPFAQMARTQENNFCVIFGILELVLTFLTMFCQAYLTFEHFTLRTDHPIYQGRRKFISMMLFVFRVCAIILQYGFLYQLSQVVPRRKLLSGQFYHHYIYCTGIYTISVSLAFLFDLIAPLSLPPIISPKLPALTQSDPSPSKKPSKLQRQREKIKNYKPLDPNDPVSALTELNSRFPEHQAEDFFQSQLTNPTHRDVGSESGGMKLPPSRIEVSSEESDLDSDEDSGDVEDWDTQLEHLDDLMDRMITSIEQRSKSSAKHNDNVEQNSLSSDSDDINDNRGDSKTLPAPSTTESTTTIDGSIDQEEVEKTAAKIINHIKLDAQIKMLQSLLDSDRDNDEDENNDSDSDLNFEDMKILGFLPSTSDDDDVSDSDVDLDELLASLPPSTKASTTETNPTQSESSDDENEGSEEDEQSTIVNRQK